MSEPVQNFLKGVFFLSLAFSSMPTLSESKTIMDTALPPAITHGLEYPSEPGKNSYPRDMSDFNRLLALAGNGNANSNYLLGKIYSDSRLDDSEKDHRLSRFYYEKALSFYDRHPGALLGLAILYERGLGGVRDVNRAISLYERAGEAGSDIAYNNLSVIYVLGKDSPQDFEKAKRYTRNAANLGNASNIEVLTHWDYFVEMSSTQDESEAEKIHNRYRELELKKTREKSKD